MAEIKAALVKQLRDQTGQAMMDCKKALVETEGDVDKAVDFLRKKGMAVLEKRGGRETREGRIISKISNDGKTAVLAMLCSETDFTANSDAFGQAGQALVEGILTAATPPAGAEEVSALKTGKGQSVGEAVNAVISTTGEKITVGPFARFDLGGSGLLHSYVHFNGKVGTLLQIETETDDAAGSEAVRTLAGDLAMHVTAANPTAVTRDDVDPELVAREKDVAAAQIKNKPAEIIEKIVVGKINKWFQHVVLLEQPFVKDDSKTVSALLDEVSKQVGTKITLKRFVRLQIG